MQCGKRRKKRKNINLEVVFISENTLVVCFVCLFCCFFFFKQGLHLVSVQAGSEDRLCY